MLNHVARDDAGVPARSAGHNVHVLGALEYFGGRRPKGGLEKPAIGNSLLQRVRYSARLLINLLQHEVAVQALLGRVRIQCTLANRTLDAVAFAIDDSDPRAADLGDIALFEENKAARDGQQRRHVRRHEVLFDAKTNDDRAALTREDEPIGIVLTHNGERVGAFKLSDCGAYRLEKIANRCEVIVDAVRDDLGIGLRGKAVTQPLKIGAQLVVVLDDAVVDDRKPVAGDMRMGIPLARHAVCGPARVCNTDVAVRRRLLEGFLQHFHLADGSQALQVLRAIQHRDAGRVIAAIFEPAQTFHQDGDDIAFGDRSDDSAHEFCLLRCGREAQFRTSRLERQFARNCPNGLILRI